MSFMFGTDGVRGTPGRHPLDSETVTRLGAATVRALGGEVRRLVVARDTRDSGPVLEQQLAQGVHAEGARLVSVGVLPTPAAAWLAASPEFDGGFVISASHNPYPDNGIKVITGDGEKASPDFESRVADLIGDAAWTPVVPSSVVLEESDRSDAYARFLHSILPRATAWDDRPRLAVDCANGATSEVAPDLLRAMGFDLVVCHATPDGRNINDGCGSTHPEPLARTVRERACGLGIAFDGDGDRAILVDAAGDVVDGDGMLFACACYLRSVGRLPGDRIVATVMSNIGLEVALRNEGIGVHRCPVGDRSVRQEMQRLGITLGGEQSGHLIFSDHLPTGDGLLTALSVLRVMQETGRSLADLTRGLEVYPQLLLNVPVRRKPGLDTEPAIADAIASAEAELGTEGRVVVRYSGTEPVLRVMIEGRDGARVRALAESIAALARECL